MLKDSFVLRKTASYLARRLIFFYCISNLLDCVLLKCFLLSASLKPCGHILGLFIFKSLACQIQWIERIHHHSEFFRFLFPNGCFCHTGLWAVGKPIGMHADIAAVDPFP